MARKLKGTAIQAGTISVTQLDNSVSTVIQTGGGPKISNIQVTDNSWNLLDDTAVDTSGGYIIISGTGFVSGALVYFNQTPANSVAFISSTTLRVTVPAFAAGTYVVYVINPDGGSAIRVPGITFSVNPAWQTSSSLGEIADSISISLSLIATDATSYTVVSGSLPPGLSLNSSTGVISGTVTGLTTDTTYTFTIRATDAQNQDSPRTFTVTVATSDPYFRLTSLLISGEQGNTVVKDSSVNNFNIGVFGDSRASNFTPYGGAWSVYFDGTDDRLSVPDAAKIELGSSNFTIEFFAYNTAWDVTQNQIFEKGAFASGKSYRGWMTASAIVLEVNVSGTATGAYSSFSVATTNNLNQWYHVAFVRSGTSVYIFRDGVQIGATGTLSGTAFDTSQALAIGGAADGNNNIMMNGYISDFRIITGQAIATSAFTPPSQPLTNAATSWVVSGSQVSLTGTVALLTCQSNRFIDTSSNPLVLTVGAGTPTVSSFNPFSITNTGGSGSMFFDGTGDYCSTTGNAAFALGTGDFCLETWIYPNFINTGSFDRIVATSDYNGVGFDWTLNNAASALYVAGTAYSISNLVIKSWNHLVYTRTSGVLRGFLNGNLSVYNASATGNVTSTADLRIGLGYSGSYYTGYVTDLRVVKGSVPVAYQTALTTINTIVFTPPTSPITAVTNTSLLTLQYRQPHNNHGFQDSSSNQFLITRNGNASQGTFSPFSQTGWSNYFDGNGDYLSIANNAALTLSTSDFTIEMFLYWSGTNSGNAGNVTFIGTEWSGSSQAGKWIFYFVPSTGIIYFSIWNTNIITATTALVQNRWYHLALTRSGTSFRLFIDGVLNATGTSSADANSGFPFYIGLYYDPAGGPSYGYFPGYLSNLRVLKGTALYTANFTPATTTLTSVANTSLLTCHANRFLDASTNNFVITPNGDTRVAAFSPFAPTAVYSPAVHGGSAYFDGTGDYLEMTYNPAFKFAASQDFCIEFWAYANASLTTNYVLSQVTTNNWGFIFGVGVVTSGRIGVQYGNGATNSVQSLDDTAAFPLYQWTHVAWSRTSGNISLFVNGTRRSTAANSNAINLTTDRGIRIGAHQDGAASTFWPGYIAGLRSIVGSSPYNAGSTTLGIPTEPPTAVANTSILLNFTDAAILDRTGRAVVETVADARTSSVQVKYGTGSMYFDGTGDYLTNNNFSNPLLSFGTGDFTIEYWVYASSGTNNGIFQLSDTVGGLKAGQVNTLAMNIYTNNAVSIYANGTSYQAPNNSLPYNTWTHFAIVRSGNLTKLYVNGTAVVITGASTSITDNTNYTATYIAIGGYYSTSYLLTGYIDDFRITRGYARYTANFTPPISSHRLK